MAFLNSIKGKFQAQIHRLPLRKIKGSRMGWELLEVERGRKGVSRGRRECGWYCCCWRGRMGGEGSFGFGKEILYLISIFILGYGKGLHNAFEEVVGNAWNAKDMDTIIRVSCDIPFNYLGLSIGSNMKSITSWKTLVDRFHMRLSSWKANLLSIGGRLTFIKSVLVVLILVLGVIGPKGTFTVKDARIDYQNILPTLAHATTWD
ncbi:hypothetical protein Tco_0996536 [Tanacetum coccineum]